MKTIVPMVYVKTMQENMNVFHVSKAIELMKMLPHVKVIPDNKSSIY